MYFDSRTGDKWVLSSYGYNILALNLTFDGWVWPFEVTYASDYSVYLISAL
jgi:hypothetical protein